MTTELAILVPAFNEEPRIGTVLDVLCSYNYGLQKRVVVIDDGSTDNTAYAVRQYPVELVSLERNLDKGAALQAGIDYVVQADYWLFIDADLINLEHDHLHKLLDPLLEDEKIAMTVGVFRGGRTITDLAHRYFGILNGQRGLAGSFVENLPDLSWSRFGVEVFLSKYAEWKNYTVDYPYLKGLTHHTKEAKFGFFKGVYERLVMYVECLRSLFFWKKLHSKKKPL